MSPTLERGETIRSKTTMKDVVIRTWPYMKKQKLLLVGTMLAVVAFAAAGRLSITVFGIAIDSGILKQDYGVVKAAALGYFLLSAGGAFMDFLHSYMFAKLGNRVLYDLRSNLVAHVENLPLSYFDRNPSGRIVTRLTNDVVAMGEIFTQGIITVFSSVVSLIAIIIAMGLISWKMTLACLLVAPPILVAITIITRKILVVLREAKQKQSAINAFVAENIGGMRVLQLYGRIERSYLRFKNLSADFRVANMKQVKLYAALWPFTNFFNGATVGAALYFGGKISAEGAITTGAMAAFILHVSDFIHPLQVILEKYSVFQNALSGAERVFTLQDETTEDQTDKLVESADVSRVNGDVEFKNVVFRYRDGLPNALDDVSLKVRPGESVALVGRTGSGKSTTITLLQRLYDATSGEVLIDGRPITSYRRGSLRSRIGVVQQDTFMFRGTVAQNISLADPAISRERIEQAARKARLQEFMETHTGGLDAKVEERGANLSFGEKQLIAFARILAFDPDILILDEATANIDSHTEHLIQEATREVLRGRTSFIVAHRISTIMDCDKIAVLDAGKIVELGSHDELHAKGGLYRKLCDAQFNEGQSIDTALTV
ncbi:MAG TPA: ABC transporter ATP-binding protein [Bdellovibrionales bacterium]|nr:ABC transporter ATP-binding protein [Bdellovibrionales bacterium]